MTTVKKRFVSVDYLRGFTVAFMIVANNPGNTSCVYSNLIHARWHGWTLVDFIFPIFLYIVGISIALARPRATTPQTQANPWPKALKRAALLFLLGLFINGFPYFHLDTLRIPGVLQRIAVVYLATLWLYLHLGRKGLAGVVACILIGYWMLWTYVPVPGLGFPTFDFEYNLESWLDQMLMRGHIWEYDTSWDPEGILSTVPCIALALFGVLSGEWLNNERGMRPWAVFAIGLLLHLGGLAWNASFPINKIITTSSFVLFAGGVGIMLLVLCHVLIDRLQLKWGTYPVISLGKNALFFFIFSELLSDVLYLAKLPWRGVGKMSLHNWLFDILYRLVRECFMASVIWSLAFVVLLSIIATIMNRKGLIVRL